MFKHVIIIFNGKIVGDNEHEITYTPRKWRTPSWLADTNVMEGSYDAAYRFLGAAAPVIHM